MPPAHRPTRSACQLADTMAPRGTAEEGEVHPGDSPEEYDTREDSTALRLPEGYESTTLGGLVSEIAGHIPLPGEVVQEDGLRLEVLASTDRRIDRIRVSLVHPTAA